MVYESRASNRLHRIEIEIQGLEKQSDLLSFGSVVFSHYYSKYLCCIQ